MCDSEAKFKFDKVDLGRCQQHAGQSAVLTVDKLYHTQTASSSLTCQAARLTGCQADRQALDQQQGTPEKLKDLSHVYRSMTIIPVNERF